MTIAARFTSEEAALIEMPATHRDIFRLGFGDSDDYVKKVVWLSGYEPMDIVSVNECMKSAIECERSLEEVQRLRRYINEVLT